MQENEFEKQVKEKMDELQFLPSAPVWENIKKSISKKKRRVLPFFFLFTMVAILSIYLFYIDQKHHNQSTEKNYSVKLNVEPKNDSLNNITKQDSLQPDLVSESQAQKSPTQKIIQNNNAKTVSKYFKNETAFVHQPLIKENKTDVITNTISSENTFNNKAPLETNDSSFNKEESSVTFIKNSILKSDTDTSIQKNTNLVKNDSVKPREKLINKTSNKNNKWQLGVLAMYSRSVITNSINGFNLNKSLPVNDLNAPGVALSNTTKAMKHPYNTAGAYNFGIIIKRQISKRSALNTGLNYVHLSTVSNTARGIDSSLILIVPSAQYSTLVNGYYRLGSAQTYLNTFDFISLPVTFQSDFLHIKNFSASYTAGLSAMQLLSSKSLIYDENKNKFFSNDALLRHTQFQLIAALNLQLNMKNKSAIVLSPHLEYSFSTFLKNNDYNSLHFLNYGIQAAWLFKKK